MGISVILIIAPLTAALVLVAPVAGTVAVNVTVVIVKLIMIAVVALVLVGTVVQH